MTPARTGEKRSFLSRNSQTRERAGQNGSADGGAGYGSPDQLYFAVRGWFLTGERLQHLPEFGRLRYLAGEDVGDAQPFEPAADILKNALQGIVNPGADEETASVSAYREQVEIVGLVEGENRGAQFEDAPDLVGVGRFQDSR